MAALSGAHGAEVKCFYEGVEQLPLFYRPKPRKFQRARVLSLIHWTIILIGSAGILAAIVAVWVYMHYHRS